MLRTSSRILLAFAALTVAALSGAQQIHVTVDGNPVVFPDVQPFMVRGRVMVPIRGVFEHMHATVEWDGEDKQVIAHHDYDELSLPVDSQNALFNGDVRHVDVPVIFTHGRVLIPLRFMSETLRSSVEWDASTQTVIIATNGAILLAPGTGVFKSRTMAAGSVVPFHLTELMRSNVTPLGFKFKANVDMDGDHDEHALPTGTTLEGHVAFVQPMHGNVPGVLGLAFDRIRMPEGKSYPITGSLFRMDTEDVETKDGKTVSKVLTGVANAKFIGYGEHGVMVTLPARGARVTAREIMNAVASIFGGSLPAAHDVILEPGRKGNLILGQGVEFRARSHDQ